MIRRRLAAMTLLTLSLCLPAAARAQATAPADPNAAKEESSGYIWGYCGAGFFACMIVFAVCKPAGRRTLNQT